MLLILTDPTSNIINKNEIDNSFGLDFKTVEIYLYILEKYFHIYIVKPYHNNLKRGLSKMSKSYFNDIELRNALINKFDLLEFKNDKGALFENFVYNQMKIKHNPTWQS